MGNNCKEEQEEQIEWFKWGLCLFFTFLMWINAQKSLDHSIEAYNQLLPLHQSKVVLSDSSIEVMEKGNIYALEPTIHNIGEGIAQNVSFKSYAVYFDKDFQDFLDSQAKNGNIPSSFANQLKYSDKFVGNLYPGTSARFGYISFPSVYKSNRENRIFMRQSVAVVFVLEYYDEMLKNTTTDKFYFKYTIGDSKVYTLLESEKNSIDGFMGLLERLD